MIKSKAILILSSALAILFTSCVGEDNLNKDESWNEDLEYTPEEPEEPTVPDLEEGETFDIDARLFESVNLDYPGLETVKKHYEDGLAYETDNETGDKNGYWLAAHYLLEYFRNRTNVVFPQIESSLLNATYTANEKTVADKALEGHFYVRNCVKTDADNSNVYVDFPDFGMETDANGDITNINWGMGLPDGFGEEAKEFASQQHRHQWMLTQAKVYRATKDENYIENWKKVYRHWVENNPVPETGSNTQWSALQPAERLVDQCSIFYYFLDSENFTPEYISFFLSEFAKTAEVILANPYDAPDQEAHNINLAQSRAVFYAAVLFPEFKNAATWLSKCTAEIEKLNRNMFFSDGGPVEYDPSYHLGNVSNYYNISILANANNVTLASDYIENLRGACNFMIDIIYPNYTIDNYNDTRSVRLTKNVLKRNFSEYAQMFPDEEKFRYMATEGKDGKRPEDLVQIYDKTGYYMMRTGWGSASSMLVLKNNTGDGSGWHCQKDNLTFTLYSNGIKFSPDAGCFTYDNGGDRTAYARADNHNTMVKAQTNIGRGQDFENCTGRFLGQYSGRGYEVIVAENDNYNDLTHRRSVFMVDKKFYVIVDEGYGSYAGSLKLLFKGGNPTNKADTGRDLFILENCDKQNDPKKFSADLPVTMHTAFSGANFVFKTFPETKDGYDSNWTTGYFSDDTGSRTQRRVYEILLDKEAGKAARFVTVIYPYGAAAEYDNINISAQFTDNTAGNEGTFNSKGPKVKVSVEEAGVKKEYNLSYTIN